jgi:hypothetical protein
MEGLAAVITLRNVSQKIERFALHRESSLQKIIVVRRRDELITRRIFTAPQNAWNIHQQVVKSSRRIIRIENFAQLFIESAQAGDERDVLRHPQQVFRTGSGMRLPAMRALPGPRLPDNQNFP